MALSRHRGMNAAQELIISGSMTVAGVKIDGGTLFGSTSSIRSLVTAARNESAVVKIASLDSIMPKALLSKMKPTSIKVKNGVVHLEVAKPTKIMEIVKARHEAEARFCLCFDGKSVEVEFSVGPVQLKVNDTGRMGVQVTGTTLKVETGE